MKDTAKKPKHPFWHYKHPAFEYIKIIAGLIAIVVFGYGLFQWGLSKYLGVEIHHDDPCVKVTFSSGENNNQGFFIRPHMEFTITAIIENHEFTDEKVIPGYILFPKKFQNLEHSPKWKFDNTKDITCRFLGDSFTELYRDKIELKPRSKTQELISYRLWTGEPLDINFINELLKLENNPVTFYYQITMNGVVKNGEESIFSPLGLALMEYKDWLTSKDDDPKAIKLVQRFLNQSILTRDQDGIYSYDTEIQNRFTKVVASMTKTPNIGKTSQ